MSDPVIYGAENGLKAYRALKKILEKDNTKIKAYTREGLKTLFNFRSKDTYMSFSDFFKVEARKAFQGTFLTTDFFIRFVKEWNQINEKYGDIQYKNCGESRIVATVIDDSEALFTPCTYEVKNAQNIEGNTNKPIKEIVSFRGRFCHKL